MRYWKLSLVSAAFAATFGSLHIQPATAAAGIGLVRNVLDYAYGTPPEDMRQELFARDAVVANEVLETVETGALHIDFLDGFDFRLGSSSRATLDKFIYDPSSEAGELTLSLKEGIFRLKTGRMKREGILVVTPVALIRVTGTDFMVQVGDSIHIAVFDGSVSVEPIVTAAAAFGLSAGEMAHVDNDGTVTPGADGGVVEAALADLSRLEPTTGTGAAAGLAEAQEEGDGLTTEEALAAGGVIAGALFCVGFCSDGDGAASTTTTTTTSTTTTR